MVSTLITCLIYLIALVLATWIAGAIFFDVGRSSSRGAMLAITWLAVVLGAFVFWQPAWQPFLLLLLLSGFFLKWWFSQQPSHQRAWDPNFSQLPCINLMKDAITVENVRNTEYRTIDDNTPRYETREYRLSELQGLDVLILYWGSKWMCHPMFVFDFGPGGRLCISIEVRYRVGQKYSLFRSLYRQQELMYVVSDERDAILRRTKHLPGHDLYLYHVHSPAIVMRSFFFEYANSINSIAEQPRWYHGLTTNCTTSIYAQGRGRLHWDWRMLFNGALDRMMYQSKLLDQSLPFESLKSQSRVNEITNSAPIEGFGDFIRRGLPIYQKSLHHDSSTTKPPGGLSA